MQKSIILELVNNGTGHKNKPELYNNEKYFKSSIRFYNIIDEFIKDLSEDEKQKALDKIFDALGDIEGAAADESFKKGFKLGLMLAAQNFLG
ncbi:MAG: hypothetical protein K2O28_01335 [Clostridia bacterium]|nr:hypothetical protein [Clostridia bacterium]